MTVLLIGFLVIATVFAGMAVGVIFGRLALKGYCDCRIDNSIEASRSANKLPLSGRYRVSQ